MYKNPFETEENSFRPRLSENLATVIRLDGKDITKNHKEFPLMEPFSFTWRIKSVGINLIRKKKHIRECYLYTCMDEISFIFSDSYSLLSCFDDGNAMYLAGIFLQEFLYDLWKLEPDGKHVLFGITIFQIPYKDIHKYLGTRKKICKKTALVYYAKEYLQKEEYHNIEEKKLKEKLIKHGIEKMDPSFFNGFLLLLRHSPKGKFSINNMA